MSLSASLVSKTINEFKLFCVYLLLTFYFSYEMMVFALSLIFFLTDFCPQIFVYICMLAFSHVSHVLCPVCQFFNYFICDFFSWNLKSLYTYTNYPVFAFWFQSFKSCLYWPSYHGFIFRYTTLACI